MIPWKYQFWHFQMFWWKFPKFFVLFSKPETSFSLNFAWLFSVIKANSSVLFLVKCYILCTKGTNRSANFGDFSAGIKIHQILVIFETTNQFFFRFSWLFNIMRHNSSVLFYLKFYILSTKGAYQNTNLVKFYVSSRKSDILHFDGLLLSKSCTVSAKKVQKSYLSWHWRVMQSLKKNWLVVSNMTWGIWWIFTQPLKSPKISLRWAIFVQSIWGLS